MPKVFGIHDLATKPGVNDAEFERFVTEEAFPALRLPGTRLYLLKGDRGERDGHYLLVFEFESVEVRDRLFPAPDTTGAEAPQAHGPALPLGSLEVLQPALEDMPPAARLLQLPYDPDARYAGKRETTWIGYRVHVTETCDADTPHLITHVAVGAKKPRDPGPAVGA